MEPVNKRFKNNIRNKQNSARLISCLPSFMDNIITNGKRFLSDRNVVLLTNAENTIYRTCD